MTKPKLAVLTGAGISAESGIRTFRDSGGLWENHDIMDVAHIDAWPRNMELILKFYNERRKQCIHAKPNTGHLALALAEANFEIEIITQNVDDLHKRAGSTKILHLHGELLKARSSKYPDCIYPWSKDINPGDLCEKGTQLRPHIVWFGEAVPAIELAIPPLMQCDCLLIVGTSLQVYPAAGLTQYVRRHTPIIYVDPHPTGSLPTKQVYCIQETAVTGVPKAIQYIQEKFL